MFLFANKLVDDFQGTIEKAWAIKAFEDAEIHYDVSLVI